MIFPSILKLPSFQLCMYYVFLLFSTVIILVELTSCCRAQTGKVIAAVSSLHVYMKVADLNGVSSRFLKNELGHSASHRFCLLVSHRLDFYNILLWLSKLCLLCTYKLLSSFRTKSSSSRQGMLKLFLQLSLFKRNFLSLCLQKCGHWTAPIYKFLISFF